MKVYVDRPRLNARAQAANFASVGGLLLLLVSVVLPYFVKGWSAWLSGLIILGALGAMVGIYLANRWVRKPRPEDSLGRALKALDDHYRLYHYPATLPCEHVLLTPAGLLAMEVVNLPGYFSYRNGRWKEAMTMGRALRYIVEERVADPVALADAMELEMGRRIAQQFGDEVQARVRALTVFTHPGAELDVEGGQIPAVKIEKLRKQTTMPGERLAPEVYERLAGWLEGLTVR